MSNDPDDDDIVLYRDPAHPENDATILAVDFGVISLLADLARPVGFSDTAFELVVIAAASLPRAQRDGFLRAVAARLSAMPTDGEVREAVAAVIG